MKLKYSLILLVVAFLFIGFKAPARAESIILDGLDVEVSELPELMSESQGGYETKRLVFSNKTGKVVELNVKITGEIFYAYSGLSTIEKAVKLQPGETRTEIFMFPRFVVGHSAVANIYLKNTKVGKINFTVSTKYYGRENACQILLDNAISKNDSNLLFPEKGERSSYRADDRFKRFYYDGSDDTLDTNWLSYTRYDAIVLWGENFKRLPLGVKNAIWDFCRVGGQLILSGYNGELPSDIRYVAPGNGIVESINYIGLGSIIFLESDYTSIIRKYGLPENEQNKTNSRNGDKNVEEETTEDVVFPQRKKPAFKPNRVVNIEEEPETTEDVVSPQRKKPAFKTNKAEKKASGLADSLDIKRYLTDSYFFERTNVKKDFLDKYERAISKGTLKFLVVFFALLIGPLNIFLLKKKNKQIWLFITVPVLSLFCCVIIFLLYAICERNRLEVGLHSFNLLDEKNNRVISVGAAAIVSGKNMKQISFSEDCAIIPWTSNYGSYHRGSGYKEREIKLDGKQNFTYGWLSAGVPFAYSFYSMKTTRARIEIRRNGNVVELMNGLGADIEEIVIISQSGTEEYFGVNIPAGTVGKLSVSPIKRQLKRTWQTPLYPENLTTLNSIRMYLASGEYAVKLKKDPFNNPELEEKPNSEIITCLAIGTMAEGADR